MFGLAPFSLRISKIRMSNFRAFVDLVLISEADALQMPDQAIFELACTHLKIKTHDVWFVGDHLQNDALSTANAEMFAI